MIRELHNFSNSLTREFGKDLFYSKKCCHSELSCWSLFVGREIAKSYNKIFKTIVVFMSIHVGWEGRKRPMLTLITDSAEINHQTISELINSGSMIRLFEWNDYGLHSGPIQHTWNKLTREQLYETRHQKGRCALKR